jgi:hypothetical protein
MVNSQKITEQGHTRKESQPGCAAGSENARPLGSDQITEARGWPSKTNCGRNTGCGNPDQKAKQGREDAPAK